MLINTELPAQSSQADWIESIQLLAEDDGAPVWTTPPVDLVVTMTIIPEGVRLSRDYGDSAFVANAAVLTAVSTDATGRLTVFDNGFIEISVDDSAMAALAPDNFGIAKRYLVFLKIQTDGFTMQFMTGILPIYRGA